ncbi:hypothetical protein BaRGS_00010317, partial [Batillaria attramentaria]
KAAVLQDPADNKKFNSKTEQQMGQTDCNLLRTFEKWCLRAVWDKDARSSSLLAFLFCSD